MISRKPTIPKRFTPPREAARRTPLSLLTLLLTLLFALEGHSADTAQAQALDSRKPAGLFSSTDTLDVTISAPWRRLQKDERSQTPYPAKILFRDRVGKTVSLDLTAERRGITRQEICSFPPIKLRFEKETVKGTLFDGQKSLKMVTHCKHPKRYEQLYILEMLAYRIYNLLTDYSFRVRPLQVTYEDSQEDKSADPRFAFLIEDESDVAERNDLKKVKLASVAPSRLDPNQAGLLGLFQYMIGNTDWASLRGPDPAECCHNIKLIGHEPPTPDNHIIPLPYDFDSAGLIGAWYAAPHGSLPIKSVTQRLYRGFCMHNFHVEGARQLVLSQQAAILALIEHEARLTSKSKKKATRYLEDFFEVAGDLDDFNKKVIQQCRR
jgi:hypothetical protein